MYENKSAKSLIIVCDEKSEKYADTLNMLISQEDGSVKSSVWKVKDYADSKSKLTSNTHILLIGNFKEAKLKGENIDFQFNKYGMHFGYLGKQAVMYVEDEMLNEDEYNKFIEFYTEYNKKIEKVNFNFFNKISRLPIIMRTLCLNVPIVPLYALLSDKQKHKKIQDQQYKCLVTITYLKWLKRFMEV